MICISFFVVRFYFRKQYSPCDISPVSSMFSSYTSDTPQIVIQLVYIGLHRNALNAYKRVKNTNMKPAHCNFILHKNYKYKCVANFSTFTVQSQFTYLFIFPLQLNLSSLGIKIYYIPREGDSQKYHSEECDYQPRCSRG